MKSGQLVWVPQGEQEEVFAGNPPGPTNKVRLHRTRVLKSVGELCTGHRARQAPSGSRDRHGATCYQGCWQRARKMESRWSVAASFCCFRDLTCFSIATASYRLHPLIILNPKNPVPHHLAKKFASCFSPGVVKVSKDGKVRIYRFIPPRSISNRESLRS